MLDNDKVSDKAARELEPVGDVVIQTVLPSMSSTNSTCPRPLLPPEYTSTSPTPSEPPIYCPEEPDVLLPL